MTQILALKSFTFVAIHERFLHYYSPSIDCYELLRFSLAISYSIASSNRHSWDPEDMAGEKLVGCCQLYICRVAFAVFGGKKAFCGRNEEYLYQGQVKL